MKRDSLPLKEGEYVVHSWGFEEGILALTNQRLVHLKGDRFFRTRHYEVKKEIPLESIKGIERLPRFLKTSMNIYTNKGKHIFGGVATLEKPKNQSIAEHFKEKVDNADIKKLAKLVRIVGLLLQTKVYLFWSYDSARYK